MLLVLLPPSGTSSKGWEGLFRPHLQALYTAMAKQNPATEEEWEALHLSPEQMTAVAEEHSNLFLLIAMEPGSCYRLPPGHPYIVHQPRCAFTSPPWACHGCINLSVTATVIQCRTLQITAYYVGHLGPRYCSIATVIIHPHSGNRPEHAGVLRGWCATHGHITQLWGGANLLRCGSTLWRPPHARFSRGH